MLQIRFVALLAAIALMFGSTGDVQAESKQYKFTNNTDDDANDLHIEFDHSVTWDGAVPDQEPEDAFKEASSKGKSTVDLAAGITGDGVDSGGEIVITFEFDGSKPKVKKYRWTNGNTLEPGRSDWISLADAGERTTISFPGAATGDGLYLILLDETEYFFNTVEFEDGIDTAARFAEWFEALLYAELLGVELDTVEVTSSSFGLGYSVLLEVVTPDSSQDVICEATPIYEEPDFTRGDIDGDGVVIALIDAIFLLELGFGDLDVDPPCMRALDVNQDDTVSFLLDTIALLHWQYGGGEAPPYPGPGECGADADSPLSCDGGGTDTDSDGLCDAGDD